jgi:hypothetical protein
MEKQPNSRMCFVCGIDNPIAFDGAPSACTCTSTPTMRDGALPASGPSPSIRATPATCTGGLSARYWTSQLKLACTLTLCLYD